MAIQKLNTARGTRHIRIKDDGKTVFISEDEYQRARKDGETVKRARTTDGAAGGSKSSSSGRKSGGSKSSGGKSGKSSSSGRKSGGSKSSGRSRENEDNFMASLFANLK